MAGKLFISYRRSEVAGYARAIYNTLCQEFDQDSIFMDVDAIEPGVDFVEVIENAVSSCDALLVLIGKNWITASGETGRRLDDPNDFVRLEIRTALARDIRVIPVLLDGSRMPESRELPDDIQALARRNALEVSNSRFNTDIDLLIETLKKISKKPEEPPKKKVRESIPNPAKLRTLPSFPRQKGGFSYVVGGSVLGLLLVGGFLFSGGNGSPEDSPETSIVNAIENLPADFNQELKSTAEQIDVGLSLLEDSKFENAIEYFSELSKLHPTEPDVYFHLGRAFGHLGTAYRKRDGDNSPKAKEQYARAIENYTLALGLKEDFAQALMNRAIDRARLDQNDPRAIHDLEKAIQIDSGLENAQTVLQRLKAKQAA